MYIYLCDWLLGISKVYLSAHVYSLALSMLACSLCIPPLCVARPTNSRGFYCYLQKLALFMCWLENHSLR